MSTSVAEKAVSELLSYLRDNFQVEERADVEIIHTPFLLPNHDCISIGITPSESAEEEFRLSDIGSVSDFFFTEGRSLEGDQGLLDTAKAITSRLGVDLQLPDIAVETVAEEMGQDLYLLMLAALGIASQYDSKRRDRRLDFPTEVKGWISDRMAPEGVGFQTDHVVPVQVRRDGAVHRVEYRVDAAVLYERPKFIQAVGNTSASYRAALTYHSFNGHNVPYEGAIVYNEAAPGWSTHHTGVLEDSPAQLVVPDSRRDEVLDWVRAETT